MERRDEHASDTQGAGASAHLPFAFLSHPTLQAVRFLGKLALPWFFTTEDYGKGILAGLVLFGLQHVAVFGFDEALVSARDLDAALWKRMRAFQDRLAIVLALVLAAAGLALQTRAEEALLGRLLVGLAPCLFFANRATLPTWLLVRERRFRDVFVVDVVSVLAFTLVTIGCARLGLGAWSLVAGWHANALAAWIVAERRARDLVPTRDGDGAGWPVLRRAGANLTGAACLAFGGDQLDGIVVGTSLGPHAMGIFGNAQNLTQVFVNWAQSLTERLLFPTLAAHGRTSGLGAGYLRALRFSILFVLPAHVVLAFAIQSLIVAVFPERWHPSAALALPLALGAAARCFDLTAVAALKADGRGRAVLRLGVLRMVLLAIGLGFALSHGLVAVMWGAFAARATSAVVALAAASSRLPLAAARAEAAIGRAGFVTASWCAAFVVLELELHGNYSGSPWVELFAMCGLALGLWSLARVVIDRAALVQDIDGVREWLLSGSRA